MLDPMQWAHYPMGPSLRAYLNIDDRAYLGESSPRPSEQEAERFSEALIDFFSSKPISSTNHWIDIANADRIIIIGSNAAENHPMSFKYVQKAIDNGAKLISLDPRYTRTSSKAHLYAPFRSGTDIALMMGIINYVLNDIDSNPDNYKQQG